MQFLNSKKPSPNYSIKKINVKRQSNYASFKIGVSTDLDDDFLSLGYWPAGVSADRWLFRLQQNRNVSQEQETQ